MTPSAAPRAHLRLRLQLALLPLRFHPLHQLGPMRPLLSVITELPIVVVPVHFGILLAVPLPVTFWAGAEAAAAIKMVTSAPALSVACIYVFGIRVLLSSGTGAVASVRPGQRAHPEPFTRGDGRSPWRNPS